MSIQGTKSTSGHKRQRSEDTLSEMGKRVFIKDNDIPDGLERFGDPEAKRLKSSMPIASRPSSQLPEDLSVARMPSTEHMHEGYTTLNNINIDPNTDIIIGLGKRKLENSSAYKFFDGTINKHKSDFQQLVEYGPRRREIINQIMEDLKDFSFIHKKQDNDRKKQINYRRLDRNNLKDKKIIRYTIGNHLKYHRKSLKKKS